MVTQRLRMLVVEDDDADYFAFKRFVKIEGLSYDYARVSSVAQAKEVLSTEAFDIALLDYRLSDGTAFDICKYVPDSTPFVIVTGRGDEEIAVQAMKAGASDYLIKDPPSRWPPRLPLAVHNSMKAHRAEQALKQAHADLEQRVHQRTEELFTANRRLQQEIEQRKRAEDALRESEERFRALTEKT